MTTQRIGEAALATFAVPTAGFNALTAKDEELANFGIAPRPDAAKTPQLAKLWNNIYSRNLHFLAPLFEISAQKRHTPNNKNGVKDPNSTSGNWSGSVSFNPAGDTLKWVNGSWTVPDPIAPSNGSFYSSAWIGIDGDNSNDVLQAGTESEVVCTNGVSVKTIYAWWEWYPNYEVKINNFPVSGGDSISCLICATSKTQATVYITNLNTLVHTSFAITAPAGTNLVGNCAEWIVERPEVGGSLTTLPRYGDVFFFDSYAGTTKGVLLNAGAGTMINMVNGTTVVSEATSVASQVVRCTCEV